MDLKLYDFKGGYLTDFEATHVYRDRKSGGYDVLGFETYCRDLEKGYRIVIKTPQLEWQEYIVNYIEETHSGLTVQCENSFYETYGEYISDRRPTGTPNACLQVALEYSRWVETPKKQFSDHISCSFYRCSVREAISQILEKTGLSLRTSVTVVGNAVTSRNLWLDYSDAGNKGYRFEYGFNASDISRTVEDDNVVTSLYGFGRGEYIEETGGYGRRVNFADLNDGKQYVEDPDAVERYGRQIFGKIEFDDTEDRAEVLRRTKEELKRRVYPRVTYAGNVVDLGFDDTVTVDERVYLIDDILGIEVEGRVLRLTEYLDKTQANLMEVGNFSQVPEIVKQKLDLKEIKEQLATDPTRGGLEATNSKLLEGFLDTLNKQMNEGLLDGKVTYFPGGTIYENENSATYIGYLGWRIANSKNTDGTWNFKTIATGDGLASGIIGADQILAGAISSDHISAGGIDAGKITIGEAEAQQSLDKALEDLSVADQEILQAAISEAQSIVENTRIAEAVENFNQAKAEYDAALLDNEQTQADVQAKLDTLESAQSNLEAERGNLEESIRNLQITQDDIKRVFATDAMGRPVISSPASSVSMVMDNDRLSIQSNGVELAFFGQDRLYITTGEMKELIIGRYHIYRSDGDGVSVDWI